MEQSTIPRHLSFFGNAFDLVSPFISIVSSLTAIVVSTVACTVHSGLAVFDTVGNCITVQCNVM